MGQVKSNIDSLISAYSQTSINLAQEVINGKWGNGPERMQRLLEAGYDPSEIQTIVNKMLKGEPIEVETMDVSLNQETHEQPVVSQEQSPTINPIVEQPMPINNGNSIYSNNPDDYRYGERTAKLIQMAKEMNMSDDQITLAIGISLWETQNFEKLSLNNFGGVTGSGDAGKVYSERDKLYYAKYSTEEAGMKDYLVNLQTNYFDLGLDTIEEIGEKYCGHDATEYNKSVLERINHGIWAKK